MMTGSDIEVVAGGAALGAEIRGVDLSKPLDAAAFSRVEDAFNRHSVVCFRDQNLNETQYLAFMERLGAVERVFLNNFAHPDYPDIFLISNIREGGRAIGHADAGSVWHTDMSYIAHPPRATGLYALEVPVADGVALGDTHFASAAAAYDGLTDADKRRVDDLIAIHHVSGRRAKTKTDTKNDALRMEMPTVVHPVVRTHPFTGRKCLYVSEGECIGIEGMDEDEALPLIERLSRHIILPAHRHTHKWRVGDLLVWDNCAVQHLASFDYKWPDHRRLMWRVTVGAAATH